MKKTLLTAAIVALGLISTQAFAAGGDCEKKAVDKNGKPLAGAAKDSFIKKCEKDSAAANPAAAACEKSAADKKLAGAAKTSHIKKCMAEAK